MSSTRSQIVWTRMGGGGLAAHFGGLCIGHAGERDDGTAYWKIDAVSMRHVAKGSDLQAKSLAAAKRALERAWQKWLDESGLILAPGAKTDPHAMWGERVR